MKIFLKASCVLAVALLLLLNDSCTRTEKDRGDQPVVIMLSMDGFRWDYPDMYSTPNLDKIAQKGVKAEALIPSFPTKTFPNHYSIATGLYPDNHGLVNNIYFDPVRENFFRLGNRSRVEDPYYYGGEPIWVTAEKQGVSTASFFWVGSEAPVKGMQPERWKKFDSSIAFEARMDTVIKWASLPENERPGLITWYMEEPDHVGHDFGPLSEQTEKVVQHLDSLLGIFIDKLYMYPQNKNINLIILSDHGMGETRAEMYVDIDKDIKEEWVEYIIGHNPVMLVQPREDYEDSVMNALSDTDHLNAWKKEEIPAHLKYGDNPRISDIVVVADSGWSIGVDDAPIFSIGGAHGYDYSNSDMHAIFYAWGPAFKENYIHPPFYNVDIYLLLSDILKIKPVETDGNYQRIKAMLRDQ